jgi:hypothetical protein
MNLAAGYYIQCDKPHVCLNHQQIHNPTRHPIYYNRSDNLLSLQAT